MLGLPASNAAPLRAALAAVKRHFLWAASFSALLNLLFLAPTIYMLQIYDRVVPSRSATTLFFVTIVLVFALATLSLLDFIRSRLLVRASARLDRQLSGTIVDAVIAQPGGTRDTMNKQAMREFDRLRQVLTGPAMIALFDAPWVPIYILVCLLIHPAIGLLALAGTLIVLAVAWRNEAATRAPLQRANEAANRSYVSQEQSMAGAEVIRALGMRRAMVERHLDEREGMMALQAEANFAASFHVALSKFLRIALQSLALGLGALLAIDNLISAGAIFASSFLLGRALAPVDQLVGNWRNIVHARGAYATLDQLLEGRDERIVPTELPPPNGQLAVENLVILNAARDGAILGDVSFRMMPGEVVAVVGPSGAGKSTLARAIAGGILPDRGSIRFDGADRSDWDPERLAAHLGYLPQDPALFGGTVKENIARFAVDAGGSASIDQMVVAAAMACGAHDMILRLPNGYDTLLGWGGRGLSAGQAQRVALARALFGRPNLLILDEPNAHLDSEGEASLVQSLQQSKADGAAVMVVAHRMGIMAVVDRILVLANGRIEAFGPRDEVLERLKGGAPRSLEKKRRAG
ncbi:type I secretion system permease/ATPase [Sphingosinicella rhizophila]|uniref:Type I secretion system permease/ATPase n=1 Tax=Sphingosinicella rhizophila TaxID=3050082 RepID=A0ABU3QAD5_9SPHN|nr:type I secretion system permease/ATPase [Sphingosinicella sp. GR2756]MDT9600381.1 type I secretion system permease/ATPase [Sphingosinicella sp. GR2756]